MEISPGSVDESDFGTVTSVSVVSANGFAGSVATPTTTPAITISTTVIGILQGDGTAISAITVGSGLDFTGGTLSAIATTPGGSDTYVQFNDAGSFGGDAGLVYNKTTDTLTGVNINATTFTGALTGNATTATTLATTRTIWGQNFNGSANVTGSLTAVDDISGGASDMVILAGTGASRTLTFQTTTSGSVATTALTLGATQNATFANNVATTENLTTVTVPAFSGASGVNWTFGAGWTTPLAGTLEKSADGTGTMTPTGTFTIVAGITYKVVVTLSVWSVGSVAYTIGGRMGPTMNAATTYTHYVTARTTGKIIFTPTNTSRFTISAISVQALTASTGGLDIYGQTTLYSPLNLKNTEIVMNGGVAVGQSNNPSQNSTGNWFFGGAGGTLSHTGGFIIGIGSSAVQNAAAGSANVGIGFNTLNSGSLTGNDNLVFGAFAGRDTTTGNNNSYYGSSSGIQVTTGSRNTGFGRETLQGNLLSAYNVAIGYQAMAIFAGTASDGKNTSIGSFAGYSLTTGQTNTIIGAGTNSTGTTGSPGITTGTGNTVLGANVTNLGNPTNNIVIAIGTGAIKMQFDATNWLVTGTGFNPVTNDAVQLGSATVSWSDLFLAEGGVINWDNGDLTLTQTGNQLAIAGGDFVPGVTDTVQLGTAALQFSDLFLAEGGVINWDNGDATLTQAGNLVTLAGADLAIPRLKGTTAVPGIAGGAGAGTTPTVGIVGTDLAGEITVTTDTDPTTSAVFVTITFTSAFTTAPYVVIYPSNNEAMLDLTRNSAGMYVNSTTTTFTINTNSNAAPSASTELKFHYQVIQ